MVRSKKIFRVIKNKNFVVLDKGFLSNKNLSAKAKGILAYLLSLPDDWKISINELVRHFKDGKKAIRSGIKELIDAGYIVYETLRDSAGRYSGGIYFVFETPSKKLLSPNSQDRNPEKRAVEKRDMKNEPLINIDNTEDRVKQNIDKLNIIGKHKISDAEKEYWKEVFKYRFSKGKKF